MLKSGWCFLKQIFTGINKISSDLRSVDVFEIQ
jgi:hypothetical protein